MIQWSAEARVAALEQTVRVLQRRIDGLIACGRTTLAPVDSGLVQTVQGNADALSLREPMNVMMHYGFSSVMPPGGDGVCLFLGGRRSAGMVIATNHKTYRLLARAEGEVALYDMWGKSIVLGASAITVQAAGTPVNIENAGEITIDTPLLRVKGDIVDNYPTNTLTLAQTRADYDIHTHQVKNVQAGGATIVSTAPTPQE